MLLEIDKVVDVLNDGKWHLITEIMGKCNLSMTEVKSVLRFLLEYEFVEISMDGRKVKIATSLQKFLLKVEV